MIEWEKSVIEIIDLNGDEIGFKSEDIHNNKPPPLGLSVVPYQLQCSKFFLYF